MKQLLWVVGTGVLLLGCGADARTEDVSSTEDELVRERCCTNLQPGRRKLVRAEGSGSFSVTLKTGDVADVHYPVDSQSAALRRAGLKLGVVVLLQGAMTDKGAYSKFAGLVSRYGFLVVVPNHLRALGPQPPALFTEQRVLTDAYEKIVEDGKDPASPLYGVVDETRLGVAGHSFGGVASLLAVEGNCAPPFCTPTTYTRPAALKGAALFGTNYTAGTPKVATPIDTSSVPVALIQGTLDGRSLPALGEMTYAELEAPKAFIRVEGANHFAMTDTAAPAGSVPDPNASTISQDDAVERVAAWSAIFLLATVNEDPAALWYIENQRGSRDGSVTVESSWR